MTALPPPAEEAGLSHRTSHPKGTLQVQCLRGSLGIGPLVDPEAGWVSKLGSPDCQGPWRGPCPPGLFFPPELTSGAAENPVNQLPLPLAL